MLFLNLRKKENEYLTRDTAKGKSTADRSVGYHTVCPQRCGLKMRKLRVRISSLATVHPYWSD
jgi:hypothetical protein